MNPPAALIVFILILLATGVMRLVEAAVSWHRLRARADDALREGWVFPGMVVLHTSLIVVPVAEVLATSRPFRAMTATLAATVLLIAGALRVWTLVTLGRSWNVRVVRPENGRIATGGPYAWIRHPNYLAVILEIAALPMLHGAWISALALSLANAVILIFRIRVEERLLLEIPAWRREMEHRSRLVPGLF